MPPTVANHSFDWSGHLTRPVAVTQLKQSYTSTSGRSLRRGRVDQVVVRIFVGSVEVPEVIQRERVVNERYRREAERGLLREKVAERIVSRLHFRGPVVGEC